MSSLNITPKEAYLRARRYFRAASKERTQLTSAQLMKYLQSDDATIDLTCFRNLDRWKRQAMEGEVYSSKEKKIEIDLQSRKRLAFVDFLGRIEKRMADDAYTNED